MIAKVLVKQKTSNDKAFDYLIEQDQIIEPLSLVEVPFRQKKLPAIVISLIKNSPLATKKINRRISPYPILTSAQLSLAKSISQSFASNLTEAIFAFVPTLNIKDYRLLKQHVKVNKPNKRISEFIQGSLWERINYYIAKDNLIGQSLVIFPEIEIINNASEIFNKLSNKKIFLWHSKISSDQKRKILNLLATRQDITVISTRHGLFLPFTNLKNIFIDQPTNFAYFEDQEPYYNAYHLARLLTKEYNNNLYVGDSIPDPLSYVAIKQGKLRFIEIKNNLDISITGTLFEAVGDIRLSKDINENNKILVLGFIKDFYSLSCKDCQQEISCLDCSSKLFSTKTDQCANCQKAKPLSCPNCKSTKIIESGITAQKISRQLINFNAKNKFVIKDFSELNSLKDRGFRVALIPYFDFYANYPFLTFREKLFRLVMSLNNFGIEKIWLSGDSIREQRFANQLSNKEWESFLDSELEARKKNMLPPFQTAIKIEARKSINIEKALYGLSYQNKINVDQDTFYVFCSNKQGIEITRTLKSKLRETAKVRIEPVEFA